MNNDVELYIRQNISWQKLPHNIKQSLGNSQKEYEKHIVNFSVKNQLRYKGNLVPELYGYDYDLVNAETRVIQSGRDKNCDGLNCLLSEVRLVRKDERRYYEEVLQYSRSGLLLYPYHLSDIMVEGLRVTPFQYYTSVLEAIMDQERSYDSLPNFTAADCLRLLGIGRNEYIDLMNQCRSGRKLFRRKNVRDLLPSKPVEINIEPWWLVAAGCIVEEDIKLVSNPEKELIDRIIDHGKQRAGDLNKQLVHSLYKKGLIYLEVPIEDSNYIVVPPLEGFVMNRVLGDYFETLLYKIFVSIDEHTSVGELASVLQIDSQLVKNAVSLYCRLGFARKKSTDTEDWHPSWKPARNKLLSSVSSPGEGAGDPCLLDLSDALVEASAEDDTRQETSGRVLDLDEDSVSPRTKRICFLFDSTLTAFLMMGNLSPGLKSHAVTMFEVGKLLDESIDGFLSELEKVSTARDDSEGEARRYFEHALILRSTILTLRHSTGLHSGLDLVRCESLYPLEPETRNRLLAKNYSLLVSMAPLSKEIRPITSRDPPHLGPASPEVNTIWFKLFLYHVTKDGPPSILLTRGTRLRKLPSLLRRCDKLLVTSWGHDPAVIPLANLLFALNDALTYSPVLAQAYGVDKGAETLLVPFPFKNKGTDNGKGPDWTQHDGVAALCEELDLEHTCGYVTLATLRPPPPSTSPLRLQLTPTTAVRAWVDKCPGVSEGQPGCSPERPRNGFHSKECADILKQELDNLSEGRPSTGSVTGSPNKMEEVEPSVQTGIDVSAWTILDCCFGVPLFEAEVNHRICATIVDKLAGQESLEMLAISNERLSSRLKQFIAYFHDLNKTQCVSNIQEDSLWPKSNLVFFKGKLREWDGK